MQFVGEDDKSTQLYEFGNINLNGKNIRPSAAQNMSQMSMNETQKAKRRKTIGNISRTKTNKQRISSNNFNQLKS